MLKLIRLPVEGYLLLFQDVPLIKMPLLKLTSTWPIAALLAFAPLLGTQMSAQTLPATAPTSAATTPADTPAAQTPAHGKHAYVTFDQGQLSIKANDSSLNVILRQISKITGMTINGGVPEERVFGQYGPDDPGTVLATLLGGMKVNVFVLGDEDNRPKELVLTARSGSASYPDPMSPLYDAEERAEELIPPPAGQAAVDLAPTGSTSPASGSSSASTPSPASVATPTATAATNTSSSATAPTAAKPASGAPQSVATPEEIYKKLLEMQKAKQGQPSSKPSTPAGSSTNSPQ